MENLLTVSEAAPKIGWKPQTIYNKISKGEFPIAYIKLPGGDVRIKPSAIESFINKRTITQN
jgi:excisionase family DNA binding protein